MYPPSNAENKILSENNNKQKKKTTNVKTILYTHLLGLQIHKYKFVVFCYHQTSETIKWIGVKNTTKTQKNTLKYLFRSQKKN